MESNEFAHIRHYLGKSQAGLARLLCASTKAIQSYEEGWRNIPPSMERQLVLLLSLMRARENRSKPCWDIKKCPVKWKKNCIVWEYRARYLCWFVNGTYCEGQFQNSWKEKVIVCQQCEVFRAIVPATA